MKIVEVFSEGSAIGAQFRIEKKSNKYELAKLHPAGFVMLFVCLFMLEHFIVYCCCSECFVGLFLSFLHLFLRLSFVLSVY